MANTDKTSTREVFGKISAYSTIVQQYLGKYLNKFSPYAKEYASSLDLALDILRTLKYSEERLVAELMETITGSATIGGIIERGYHGSLNSLESKLAIIESKSDDNSFLTKLEDAVKVTISTILTSFLSCSVSPFIPYDSLDKTYKDKGLLKSRPINIPTHILDFSNTLHVSPVSESGIYFYNTGTDLKFYRRNDPPSETASEIDADIREPNSDKYFTYTYSEVDYETLFDEEKKKFRKVVSVPSSVTIKQDERPPQEYIYTARPSITAEGLYKTDDMNAFIWYVANRGDNIDGDAGDFPAVVYEYNKMTWDSRRVNARNEDERRSTSKDWTQWLKSRDNYQGDLSFQKDGKDIASLYPILQMEPSEGYGDIEHLLVTFPAQRYTIKKKGISGKEYDVTRTIYKFNADYLRSIRIFNWKTIIMNLLYELNGISPVPDISHNLSLSDEIIDAKLSTLILNTITADDKEVDDSYYSFTNDDFVEALKRMEIKKYSGKGYTTAASDAIQNNPATVLDAMNSVSTAATLNEISSTITRGVYSVDGTSGSTGITKTELSFNLGVESNFVYQVLFAIVRPLVRAILSPQIMLLFCINLDVMGLINLKDLGRGDFDAIGDFIFRKLSGIIKKLIIQIKDEIVLHLLEIIRKELKKLVDEVIILLLLEQLNDYIRLLTQIMECIRKFGIGTTVSGIDEVTYADIIPEATQPKKDRENGGRY